MKTLLFEIQMHNVTILFVCIETVIFFCLMILHRARPGGKKITRSLILIFLLIICNFTEGLFSGTKPAGSFFTQITVLLANIGFLLFSGLQLIRLIEKISAEKEKFMELKQQWRARENSGREKDERIKELEKINEQERNNSTHLEVLIVQQEKLIESEQLSRKRLTTEMENKNELINELKNIIEQERNNSIYLELNAMLDTTLKTGKFNNMERLWPLFIEKRCRSFGLTPWQTKIVGFILKVRAEKNKGKDKIIAKKLCIAVNTLRKHIQNIFGKVGVSSKDDLILKLINYPSDQINYKNGADH